MTKKPKNGVVPRVVITRGAIIVNVNDPRHVGRVVRVHTRGTMARIQWLETAWIEISVPVADLRDAREYGYREAQAIPAQERMAALVGKSQRRTRRPRR